MLQKNGLKPCHKVLDVGCGAGRMAIPLTTYLNEKQGGSYEGFDIVAEGIRFCQKRITPKFPHFHFQRIDLHNTFFNPKGKYKAHEYRFPYKDNTFDMIFLVSVFTHMLTKDMEHYIYEINRVLKPGGKSFITYFLLNYETRRYTMAGVSNFDFRYSLDERCFGSVQNVPEFDTAYEDKYILELYKRCNLNLARPIRYGFWRVYKSGDQTLKKKYRSHSPENYQDVIIAIKSEK